MVFPFVVFLELTIDFIGTPIFSPLSTLVPNPQQFEILYLLTIADADTQIVSDIRGGCQN